MNIDSHFDICSSTNTITLIYLAGRLARAGSVKNAAVLLLSYVRVRCLTALIRSSEMDGVNLIPHLVGYIVDGLIA